MTATTRTAPRPAVNSINWRSFAACRSVDLDLHFPIPHTPGWKRQTKAAKQICGRCPVRQRCLDWALATRQPAGIWGGMSERERRVLLGMPEQPMERCMSRQAWIEQQLAAGKSQREVARRLGVERVALQRALARFAAEREAAGEVQAA